MKKRICSAPALPTPPTPSILLEIPSSTPLTDPKGSLFAANVTFEPGCRNNWHIHHAKSGGGQILICVAGRGFYQEWGRAAVELLPGDTVNIPTGVRHWHGAAPDSWFSHLAVEVPGQETSNEWLEAVSDGDYAEATASGRNSDNG